MKFHVVMGWDFGHGENSVNIMRIDKDDNSIISLNLDRNKNRELISVILCEGGEIRIGNEAKSSRAAIPYFKERPDLWDTKIAGRAKKDLMFSYFNILMKNIYEYNPDYLHEDDNVLLLVGCPTSDEWLDPPNAYRDLVKFATGAAEVVIVPESRAALFSAFTPHVRSKANTENGAIVFDLGSSTLDFTYMLLGKRLIERSCTLGASHIERAMLKAVLAENGMTPGGVWDKEIGVLELEMRMQKERFYSETVEKPYMIELTELDENGDPVMRQDRKGRTVEKTKTLSYRVDDDFMDGIIREEPISVEFDGTDAGYRSWHGHLEAFFRSTKAALDDEDPPLPYETIILTGGASRMPFVKELCESVFGREPQLEANPSHSVAKGLCFLGVTDQKLPDLLANATAFLHTKADEAFDEMKTACVSIIAERAYSSIRDVLSGIADGGSDITIGQLGARINAAMGDALSQDRVQAIVKSNYMDWLRYCKNTIVDVTNNAANEFYPDRIGAEHFRISEDMITSFNDLAFSFASNATELITMDFRSTVNKIINHTLAIVVSAIVAAFTGPFAVIAAPIAYAIMLGIADAGSQNNDKELKSGIRQKIKRDFEKKKTERVAEISAKVYSELGTAFEGFFGRGNEKIYAQLDVSLAEAFDIITLRKFGGRKVVS